MSSTFLPSTLLTGPVVALCTLPNGKKRIVRNLTCDHRGKGLARRGYMTAATKKAALRKCSAPGGTIVELYNVDSQGCP